MITFDTIKELNGNNRKYAYISSSLNISLKTLFNANKLAICCFGGEDTGGWGCSTGLDKRRIDEKFSVSSGEKSIKECSLELVDYAE